MTDHQFLYNRERKTEDQLRESSKYVVIVEGNEWSPPHGIIHVDVVEIDVGQLAAPTDVFICHKRAITDKSMFCQNGKILKGAYDVYKAFKTDLPTFNNDPSDALKPDSRL